MHYRVTTSLHLNQPHINHIQHFDREKQTNKSIKTKTPKIDKKVRGGLLNYKSLTLMLPSTPWDSSV